MRAPDRCISDSSAPAATTDEYVERRAAAVRAAVRKHGGAGGKRAGLPVVLVENSSRAATDAAGQKLLGNKRPWLPDLMRQAGPPPNEQHQRLGVGVGFAEQRGICSGLMHLLHTRRDGT